jgi:hypothetical protein
MIHQGQEVEATMMTYQNGVKIMDQDVNPLVEIHSTRKRVNNPLAIGTMIVPQPARAPVDTALLMVEDTQMMLRMMMVGLGLVGEVGTRSRLVEVGVEEEVVVVVGAGTMITSSLPQRRRLMVIQTGNMSSRLVPRQKRRLEGRLEQ